MQVVLVLVVVLAVLVIILVLVLVLVPAAEAEAADDASSEGTADAGGTVCSGLSAVIFAHLRHSVLVVGTVEDAGQAVETLARATSPAGVGPVPSIAPAWQPALAFTHAWALVRAALQVLRIVATDGRMRTYVLRCKMV